MKVRESGVVPSQKNGANTKTTKHAMNNGGYFYFVIALNA